MQRSGLTDEFAVLLGRIADSLERIANQPADRSIAEAYLEAKPSPEPETSIAAPALHEQTHPIPYSMFGR